jgi:transcriptional regulator with XRE-family HTH domain
MDNIKELFASNLRENRRKSGLTQAQLAEQAEVSTHYIALIELARNIPKVETIERLANALNVEIYELFIVDRSPKEEIEQLKKELVYELKETVSYAVKESTAEEYKKQKKR